MEFGAKLDLSIDENGMARLERLSFDVCNESDVFISDIERYKEWISHYPQRVLVDRIYRNRENLPFCRQKAFGYPGRRWEDQERMPWLTKKQDIETMKSVWRSNGHSVWLSGVLDLGRS